MSEDKHPDLPPSSPGFHGVIQGRGRSKAYSEIRDGGFLVLYCEATDEALREARDHLNAARDAVLAVCPRASARFSSGMESSTLVMTIDAEELATFPNGPMHREAIAAIRHALKKAMDRTAWLESEAP